MIASPWLIFVVGAIGACLGSFAATLGLRMTRSQQAIFGRSACDGCGALLKFADTAPVVSYLWRRGACASCGVRIDPLHLVGEAAGAAVLVAAFVLAPIERSLLLAALGLALIVSAVVDAKTRRLPDAMTLILAGLGLGLDVEKSMAAVRTGPVAAVATFVVLETVRRVFAGVRGQQGLGFGDVKLMAALALWLGSATPSSVALSSAVALAFVVVARPDDGRIAFGPAIALSSFIVGMAAEASG